jgi:hypothetical protein
MTIVNSLATWYFKTRIKQIEEATERPVETQMELFNELIRQGRRTEIGKDHDFKSIRNYREYSERVPIRHYEDFKPYIDRMLRGEQGVLWPGDILWFAKSSGTTGDKSKFIPVSFEALDECQFRGARDLLTIYSHNNPQAALFDGKGLLIGGSNEINKFGGSSYYGDLSAVMMNNLPVWVNLFRTPKPEVALMPNWEDKLFKMADETIHEDVRSISGVPTWTLLLIKELLRRKDTDNLLDVWPNIELFLHGGVSFEPYRSQFESLIPSGQMHYLESYNASEGFFSIQDSFERDDMLLMMDYGIFYEFAEDYYSDDPKIHTLETVEAGKSYALIITTNGGLWRYWLGDVITFTDTKPFRIQISGRTKLHINVFGEELMIHNAERALQRSCEEEKAIIRDFTAGPIPIVDGQPGGHEWIIEFEQPPADQKRFNQLLDQYLKDENSDYEAKRSGDLAMKAPVIRVAPDGTFYQWMKNRNRLGGQNKVPRLSNNRTIVDSLNELMKTENA